MKFEGRQNKTLTMQKRWLFALLLILGASAATAVEVAPRISDREIIESLTELKAGQKMLEARMDQRFEAVDQRFESMDKRMESMEASFNQRFNFLENLIMVVIAGIFGLIGYVVWDRKTVLRPVEERLIKLEHELHRDLEIQHEDGSRLTRLVKVLREMAKQDEKLAGVLRSFSLL